MKVFMLFVFLLGCADTVVKPTTSHNKVQDNALVDITKIEEMEDRCRVCEYDTTECSAYLTIVLPVFSFCTQCQKKAFATGDVIIDHECMSKASDCKTASRCLLFGSFSVVQ